MIYRLIPFLLLIFIAACHTGPNYTITADAADSVAKYTSRMPGGALLMDFVIDDSTYFSRMDGEEIVMYCRSTRSGDTLRVGGHGADYFPAAVMVSVLKDDYFVQLLLTEKMNSKLDMNTPPIVNCTEQSLILSEKPVGKVEDTVAGIASFTTEQFTITDPQGGEHKAKIKGRFYFRALL